MSIGSPEKMEPITKVSHIPSSRWALVCSLCNEKIGASIQVNREIVNITKTLQISLCNFYSDLHMLYPYYFHEINYRMSTDIGSADTTIGTLHALILLH